MTTPHTIYTALVARFGREAVDAGLRELGVEWGMTGGRKAGLFPRPHGSLLPDPAAVVLLCDVAEGLFWARGFQLEPRITPNGRGFSWFNVAMSVRGHGTVYPTKPAAVLAALESEAK